MTDLNVRTREIASDCRVCGNMLASPDVECPRCKSKPAAESSPPEALTEEVFFDRSGEERSQADSPYPSASKQKTSTFPSSREPGRRIKLAAAALIALTALIAGASYLYSVSSDGKNEATPVARPLAENSGAVIAQTGTINAPVTARLTSIDSMAAIDAIRSAMVQGELKTARQQLAMLPPAEDQRTDVRRINDELVQREHARDSALDLARACEKTGDVPCVLRSAGDALASDVSDSEARAMLLRAVTQSGANQATALTINQAVDASNVAHRQVSEKRRIRHERQILANNNAAYGKH